MLTYCSMPSTCWNSYLAWVRSARVTSRSVGRIPNTFCARDQLRASLIHLRGRVVTARIHLQWFTPSGPGHTGRNKESRAVASGCGLNHRTRTRVICPELASPGNDRCAGAGKSELNPSNRRKATICGGGGCKLTKHMHTKSRECISRSTLEKHSREALSREMHSRDALSRVYLIYVRACLSSIGSPPECSTCCTER